MPGRKRLLGRIFYTLVLSLILIFVTITINKIQQNELIAKQIENIPLLKAQQVYINDKKWDGLGHQIIIIFYNSSCHICHYEIEAINENISSFNGVYLLFISDESIEQITDFGRQYKLNNRDNIWWLKMQPNDVYETFGDIGTPHIWIYNKEGHLVKEFKGSTKIDALLEYL
jgi:thioredoxin-related protein